ncbi:hypothetical protein [Amycolatopsis sp. NPDC004378]
MKRPDLAERNRAAHEHRIWPPDGDGTIKHCTGCCVNKPLNEFARDSRIPGGRREICSPCAATKAREAYRQNGGKEKQLRRRKALIAARYEKLEVLKDAPCTDCRQRFPRVCMDFDHVRGDKVNSISRMIRMAYSWELIEEEIKKCELVCSNCHRIRTAERGQWHTAPANERAV